MKNILIIQGHPNKDSFCSSLADKYIKTAKSNNNNVELVNLGDLNFDPILRGNFSHPQALEPDLKNLQEKILWANHIVWIFPIWWGSLPALLKGFIDRTFLPGFAFKYKSGFGMPEKLLIGRTSEIISTLDTPIWFYKWFLGAPGMKIMKNGILEFCGLKVVKSTLLGPIKSSSEKQRTKWLAQI
ncbi:MAG: NAD(P)H-dependent oxidoreductase [Bacteriovoracaceae bacterium]|nr:NAD(P)H-dependent oxidoreductase [Bacteriovoracaceae bacterium]